MKPRSRQTIDRAEPVCENTSGKRELWHVPEVTHGAIPEIRSPEYERRVATFFAEAMDLPRVDPE